MSFVKINFSQTNKYIAVQCTEKLMIFDSESAKSASINEELLKRKATRLVEPTVEFTISDTTYDRILGQYMNEDDVNKSWVLMQSSMYGQIHLLPLVDILENAKDVEKNKAQAKKSLGGQFIDSTDQILFKIQGNDDLHFWNKITARFTRNG